MEKNTILEIRNMNISFSQYQKGTKQTKLPVIRDLSLTVHQGEMVAVVGSSGSGKSLLAHGVMKVGTQICKGKKDPERKKKLDGIFRRYGLAEEVQEQYPFELSGGMTRRVMISTAMIEEPKLVIADEPTPGLHLKAAKRAMEHFRELADMGAGVLIITHDLELALETADRVLVFYAGHTLEDAKTEDFRQEKTLRHPYTKALWRAMPQNGFNYIDGVQPYVKDMPEGCPFAPRCEKCTEKCRGEIPYREVNGGYVRCVYDS